MPQTPNLTDDAYPLPPELLLSDEPTPDPGFALDLAAAEVRADSADLDALVTALAARLEEALPRVVAVRRRKVGGFRSKETEVQAISLSVGDERFELVRTPAGFECTRHDVVRGITLKRERQVIADWIKDVVAAVTRTAELGQQARSTLEGLVR